MLSPKFGFMKELPEEFPSQVIVDLTEVCNLACIHCPHPEFKKSIHYSGRFLEPNLNTKLVDEIREDGKEHCKYLRYTSNGEPLIHPKGYSLIKYAVDRSGVFVCLTTNGTIMNEKRTRELLDSGIHMIDISIDAVHPDTYAKIRVGGDLTITRDNVLRLISWADKTKVVVSFVEQPENTGETQEFKIFWEDNGADFVIIRTLHSAAGIMTSIADDMRSNKDDRFPCRYPWERLVLDPKGFLAFCPTDWKYGSPISDFRTTGLKEAWQSKFMKELREAHLSNNFSCHKFCGQCPDWRHIHWPGQGGKYSDMVHKLIGS